MLSRRVAYPYVILRLLLRRERQMQTEKWLPADVTVELDFEVSGYCTRESIHPWRAAWWNSRCSVSATEEAPVGGRADSPACGSASV